MEINIQTVSMTYPNGKQALKDLNLDLHTPSLMGLLGDIVNNSWHIFLKHSHTYAAISNES